MHRWRVRWTQEFRWSVIEFIGRSGWRDVKRFLKSLERSLNTEPAFLDRLKRNRVVMEYAWVRRKKGVTVLDRARRMRYRGRRYRLFYVLYEDIGRVWFVGFEPRTDSTYRKKRLR